MSECHLCEEKEATTEVNSNPVCEDCAGVFSSSPDGPEASRETFAKRLREAELDTTRFIDVWNGKKGSNDHTLLSAGSDNLSGNYGIYAGPGETENAHRVLVEVDVDDYSTDNDLPAELTGLPDTFSIKSPHTNGDIGGHRHYSAPADLADALQEAVGTKNPSPDWGEIRVHNQYCVGPGSQLDGCTKDWCDDCKDPDKGYYSIANDVAIAHVDTEEVLALVGGDTEDDAEDTEEPESSSMSLDTETYQEQLEKAMIHSDDEKNADIRALWTGDYTAAGFGDDRSGAETSLANRLGWWLGADKDAVRNAMNGIDIPEEVPAPMLHKWPKKGESYRVSILKGVDNVDEHYFTNNWNTVLYEFNNPDIPAKNARYSACMVLEDEFDFVATRRDEDLLIYDPDLGIYTDIAEQQVGSILEEKLGRHYNYTTRGLIVDRLKQRNWFDDDDIGGGENEICVANGILNCKTLEHRDHTPDTVFTRHVPTAWPEEGAKNPAVDKFLNEVFDGNENVKKQMYQLMGHALHPGQPKPVLAFLYGDGQNGKSLVLQLVEKMVGLDNTASTKLHDLANDDHALDQQKGKLYNFHDDLSSDRIRNTGTIKSLTGGGRMEANPKNRDRYMFEAEATQMFACNEPPKIVDGTHALNRRLVHIRMPVRFTPPDKPGPDEEDSQDIKSRLFTDEELAATMRRALEAYQDVYETGKWAAREDVEDNREHWERASRPVKTFLDECVETTMVGSDRVRKGNLFDLYDAWADKHEMPTKTRAQLGQKVNKELVYADKQTGRYEEGKRDDRFHGVALTENGFDLIQDNEWEQTELDVDFVDDVENAIGGTATKDLPFKN